MMQVLASSLVFGSGGYNLQGWFRLYHPHQIPNVILPRIHIWELGLVLPPPSSSHGHWPIPSLTSSNGPWLLLLVQTGFVICMEIFMLADLYGNIHAW